MNVKIAGAGLMGRMLGWHFAQLEHDVTLFERSAPTKSSSAAHVSASMLAPQSERPEADPSIWNMAQESLQIWPRLLNELEVPYAIEGSIVVAHPSDEALLRKFEKTLARFKTPDVHLLQREELNTLEPDLSNRFNRGVFLKHEGWLDNRALLTALESRCGTIVYNAEVDPYTLDADLVLDCRGIGADDPELRGVRGEVVRVFAPEVRLRRPIRLLHPKYRIYISPRSHSVYLIGATQIESDVESGVTIRSALELLSAACTVHEGFEEAEILELNSGLRPAYPDNLPRIYWHRDVLHVNGLYRHGFLIAPSLVNSVSARVQSLCTS